MTHKSENYSIKMQKYYFRNGTILILLEAFQNSRTTSPAIVQREVCVVGHHACRLSFHCREYVGFESFI
jgi:hypothetical protein